MVLQNEVNVVIGDTKCIRALGKSERAFVIERLNLLHTMFSIISIDLSKADLQSVPLNDRLADIGSHLE